MVTRSVWAVCLSGLFFSSSLAWGAGESAQEIARKAREQGGLDLLGLTASLKLVTVDEKGSSKEQLLSSSSKKIDGRTHAVSRFSSPPGVAGVAVLSIESRTAGEPSEVSLFLPKLQRVRKIARGQRGQSFMDTDFSFADLGGSGVDERKFERQADAKVEGRDCYVLQADPGDESPYGRMVLSVDKETYVAMKADYFDKEKKPLKTFRTLKLKKFKGRVLGSKSVMENLQKKSKTTLEIQELEDLTLGDEAFSERALERG